MRELTLIDVSTGCAHVSSLRILNNSYIDIYTAFTMDSCHNLCCFFPPSPPLPVSFLYAPQTAGEEASIVGIVSGLYFGLGTGLGALVGGVLNAILGREPVLPCVYRAAISIPVGVSFPCRTALGKVRGKPRQGSYGRNGV